MIRKKEVLRWRERIFREKEDGPENDDDGRFRVGNYAQTLPDHQARSDDRCKVQGLE